MKKIALCVVTSLAMCFGGPAMAQDFDDLANSGATVSSRSQAADLLDEIETLLEDFRQELGGNFVVQVQKNSPEDVRLSPRFEAVNVQLSSLWTQFFSAVDQEVERRQFDRDQTFQQAVAQAYQAYRSIFQGGADNPTVQYEQFRARAGAKNLVLRRDKKFWFDPKVKADSGVSGVSSWNSPTTWDENEAVYAMGLMPAEMLSDVNRSIRSAYFYGYMSEWVRLDPSASVSRFGFLGLPSYGTIGYDYMLPEATYYDNLYSSRYLVTMSNEIRATTPRAATGSNAVQSMGEQVEGIQSLLTELEGFQAMVNEREGRQVVTNDKGNMYLHRSIDAATADRIMEEYRQICQRFRQAMDTYKIYLDSYRNNFGGAESLALQQAMQQAFNTYRQDFVYSEIDGYLSRYDALKARAQSFKLDRRATFGAVDRGLDTPFWRRPRRELYSAQRLITLLPGDMLRRIDDKRRWAYQRGQWNAEAEYRDATNYSYGSTYSSSQYTYATEPGYSGNGSSSLPGDDLGGGSDYPSYGGDSDYPSYGGDSDYPSYGGDSDYPDYEGGLPGDDL